MPLFTRVRRRGIPRSSQVKNSANFAAFWGFSEVRTISQANITLSCLPGLSFAGLREEQESERFRVVRTLPDTAFVRVRQCSYSVGRKRAALKGCGRRPYKYAYSALGSVGCSEVKEPGPFLGRRRVNVEPLPGVLSALIWPPWDSAIWRAMESPRPAPPAEREGSVL